MHGRARDLVVSTAVVVTMSVLGTGPVEASTVAGNYTDLEAAGAHRSAVESLAAEGVFDGTECGPDSFCPTEGVPRWVMAVWLVRILDRTDPDPVGSSRFDDVDPAVWWAPHVDRLAELGITKGCSITPALFCPDETVTRARMASFLVRAFQLSPADPAGFVDVQGGVHAVNIDALAAAGVTSGCSTSPPLYCPDGVTSRSQMATFLSRGSKLVTEPLEVPPARLGLPDFYQKYLDADGIPIVSSAEVPDRVLYAVARIIDDMLSERSDLRKIMARAGTRVAVMANGTTGTDLPEFRGQSGLGDRVRGGGFFSPANNVMAIAEENLVCLADDVFPFEDIAVHEFAHAMYFDGVLNDSNSINFRGRLERSYREAMAADLWKDTYAATNRDEYWAEGVQSWFGLNDPPGPIHNDVNTRAELEEYDPALAGLIREVFGDADISSSCHENSHPQENSYAAEAEVSGVVTGPDGIPTANIDLWLSMRHGNVTLRWYGQTDTEGKFRITVPRGSYALSYVLEVDAALGGQCAGWYSDGGITTTLGDATRINVDGTAYEPIVIRLPAFPGELPGVEC